MDRTVSTPRRKGSTRLLMRVALLCIALRALAQSGTPAQAPDRSSLDGLVGLWGSENTFGPLVRGELTIDARGPDWHARIAGFESAVRHDKGDVRFALAGKQGEFRGHLNKDGKKIVGHWIQPGGTVHGYGYATPVVLSQVSTNVWRGTVVPLDERMSFYLFVQQSADQSLSAVIRNPEANWFRRRTYTVARQGSTVTLSQGNNQMQGTYDEAAGSLWLPVVESYPPTQFTRRTEQEAVGFYPRLAPHDKSYEYHPPVAEDDGWATASLSDVGLDLNPIAALVERILAANPADNPVNFQSLLIARHGKLVFEEYFNGFDKERLHDMRSASKTFGPLLVGLAREHGAKIERDSPAYSFFAEYKPFANWDDRKNRVTVEHLMNMVSGVGCDDRNSDAPGGEDYMQDQKQQPDWYRYFLDLPMAHEPGGKDAIYCSSSINVLGGIVQNATGRWLPEFFGQYVAEPLQFRSYSMNLMPTGNAYMGGGLYLRPRDQLKLGQLYLNGGTWNGHRVIGQAWVKDSFTPHSGFQPAMKEDVDHGYSYAWHTRPLKVGDRVYRDYFAAGNGGQQVIVISDLDLVIGFTGGSYSEGAKFYRWEMELVPQYIIPAALGH